MSKRLLGDLLVAADAGADQAFQPPPGFAGKVVRLARRRTYRRAGLGTVAAAALLLVAATLLPRGRGVVCGRRPAATAERNEPVSILLSRLAELDQQAQLTALIAERMRTSQQREDRIEALENILATSDPSRELDRQIEQAAFTIALTAELAYRELNSPDQAKKSYELVVRDYPHTSWAELARKRLAEIRNRQPSRLQRKETNHEQAFSHDHDRDRAVPGSKLRCRSV